MNGCCRFSNLRIFYFFKFYLITVKIQDIGFIIVTLILLFLRKPKSFTVAGLLCFALAIPLYAKWVFFTAHRLVMYGAFFIFVETVFLLWEMKENK